MVKAWSLGRVERKERNGRVIFRLTFPAHTLKSDIKNWYLCSIIANIYWYCVCVCASLLCMSVCLNVNISINLISISSYACNSKWSVSRSIMVPSRFNGINNTLLIEVDCFVTQNPELFSEQYSELCQDLYILLCNVIKCSW